MRVRQDKHGRKSNIGIGLLSNSRTSKTSNKDA